MNLPSKLASNWFGDKERAMASTLGTLSVYIGFLISIIIPQFIFKNDFSDNLQQGRIDFCMYLMI
jgi:MFS transporter, FLVCR family, feline leukemia virus subgroup C receptor-related protein